MRLRILSLIVVFTSMNAFAQAPYTNARVLEALSGDHSSVYPVVQDKGYILVGKGMTHLKWGSIALLCVGAPLENGAQGCEKLRHAFFSVIGKNFFFGRTLNVSTKAGEPSRVDVENQIRRLYKEGEIAFDYPLFFSRVVNSSTSQLINKDGWNWSQDGFQVREKKFWRYFFMVNLFIEHSE